MKLKTLALAVAILAVLSLAAYYLQRPPATAGSDPRVHQPVFDAKLLEKTAKISLADQGKTVVLARQPDGKWVVPSYYDLPADFSKLSRFIDDLSGAKIQRLVTQNPERLARLDGEQPGAEAGRVAKLRPSAHRDLERRLDEVRGVSFRADEVARGGEQRWRHRDQLAVADRRRLLAFHHDQRPLVERRDHRFGSHAPLESTGGRNG